MITSGGELTFVTRMIEESRTLDDQVLWYTAMLGKISSVTSIVETLIAHKNHNYAVTEFIQGSKTRRWAVAWTWTDMRPAMVSPLLPSLLLPVLPIYKPDIGLQKYGGNRQQHAESPTSQNTSSPSLAKLPST